MNFYPSAVKASVVNTVDNPWWTIQYSIANAYLVGTELENEMTEPKQPLKSELASLESNFLKLQEKVSEVQKALQKGEKIDLEYIRALNQAVMQAHVVDASW